MAQLTSAGCKTRRQRFLKILAESRLNAALITDVRDIYYFTGTLLPSDLPAALLLEQDGKVHCIAPTEMEVTGTDHCLPYEWQYRGTRHPDPTLRMLHEFNAAVKTKGWRRVGMQSASLPQYMHRSLTEVTAAELLPIDESLAALQRRKDADELEVIRASIAANLAAYDAVGQAIHSGANELDILAAGRRGAMLQAGEKLFHDGDYQCGAYNGPARNRTIKRGELYIVDAWTCYRGYWCDMSRTFVVGAPATEIQQSLFDHIHWVLHEAAQLLRPGTDGAIVYRAMDEMIRQFPRLADRGLIHHGGHAIGLRIHEMPDVNLDRGGQLEAGNIVCLEPGGYFPDACFGVRLENMFLVTSDGGENLCPGDIKLRQCG
jgi:Xaa-Pro aminopeptidase